MKLILSVVGLIFLLFAALHIMFVYLHVSKRLSLRGIVSWLIVTIVSFLTLFAFKILQTLLGVNNWFTNLSLGVIALLAITLAVYIYKIKTANK